MVAARRGASWRGPLRRASRQKPRAAGCAPPSGASTAPGRRSRTRRPPRAPRRRFAGWSRDSTSPSRRLRGAAVPRVARRPAVPLAGATRLGERGTAAAAEAERRDRLRLEGLPRRSRPARRPPRRRTPIVGGGGAVAAATGRSAATCVAASARRSPGRGGGAFARAVGSLVPPAAAAVPTAPAARRGALFPGGSLAGSALRWVETPRGAARRGRGRGAGAAAGGAASAARAPSRRGDCRRGEGAARGGRPRARARRPSGGVLDAAPASSRRRQAPSSSQAPGRRATAPRRRPAPPREARRLRRPRAAAAQAWPEQRLFAVAASPASPAAARRGRNSGLVRGVAGRRVRRGRGAATGVGSSPPAGTATLKLRLSPRRRRRLCRRPRRPRGARGRRAAAGSSPVAATGGAPAVTCGSPGAPGGDVTGSSPVVAFLDVVTWIHSFRPRDLASGQVLPGDVHAIEAAHHWLDLGPLGDEVDVVLRPCGAGRHCGGWRS